MTPNEFYEQYGRHIYRMQQGRQTNVWPYVSPNRNKPHTLFQHINPNITQIDKLYCYGIDYQNISAVIWCEGKIAFYPVQPSDAVISFGFEGCYMVKFNWGNQCYIGHIHSSSDIYDCKGHWRVFQQNYIHNNKILFRPTDNNDDLSRIRVGLIQTLGINNPKEIQICGFITPTGQCYSIILNMETCMPYYIKEMLPLSDIM